MNEKVYEFNARNLVKCNNSINFFEYNNIEIVNGTCIHSFPEHIHKNLCIGTIISGTANFTVNGINSSLSVGDRYIIPPYTPHSLSSVNSGEFSYKVICFKGFSGNQNIDDIISLAINHIENRDKELSINELSKSIYISKYHFIRKFKNQVGVTPYQFYINEKVKKIRRGLQQQLSLSDLTYELGFSDESHLCNTFKKYVGISPMQYISSYRRF